MPLIILYSYRGRRRRYHGIRLCFFLSRFVPSHYRFVQAIISFCIITFPFVQSLPSCIVQSRPVSFRIILSHPVSRLPTLCMSPPFPLSPTPFRPISSRLVHIIYNRVKFRPVSGRPLPVPFRFHFIPFLIMDDRLPQIPPADSAPWPPWVRWL